MRCTIVVEKSVVKFFADLRDRAPYERLRDASDSLADDPHPARSKRLVGRPDYRLMVGDYRILYTMDEGRLVISVIEIGHRWDIYR